MPESLEADFDIFEVGSCRSMTLAPAFGWTAFGTTNVSPNLWLNLMATSRVISTC